MYELIVVVSSRQDPDSVIRRVEKMVKDSDASDVTIDSLGKKQLAYPIQKQTEGYFVLFNFEMPGEGVSKVDDMLRIEREEILRYLLIKKKVYRSSRRRTVVPVEVKKEPTRVTVQTTVKPAAKTEEKDSKEEKKVASKKPAVKKSAAKTSTKTKKAAKGKK